MKKRPKIKIVIVISNSLSAIVRTMQYLNLDIKIRLHFQVNYPTRFGE